MVVCLQVPTATRYCRCGYDFKKPKPDSKGEAGIVSLHAVCSSSGL